jgi:hypothetical protein
MTCLKVIGKNLLFCGQETGFLTIVDYSKHEIMSEGKIMDKLGKSHINSIAKTESKGLYVIATNKGLSLVKINEKNHSIMI